MFVKVSLEIRLVLSDINKGFVKIRILTCSVYCVRPCLHGVGDPGLVG